MRTAEDDHALRHINCNEHALLIPTTVEKLDVIHFGI
jgi:hypothetical protein